MSEQKGEENILTRENSGFTEIGSIDEKYSQVNYNNNKIECLNLDILSENIKSLLLNDNLIRTIIGNNLKNLVMLKLSKNYIKNFDNIIGDSLEYLDLSHNCIKDLSFLKNFPKLKKLIINSNNIKEIPDCLPETLEIIDLSSNSITELKNIPKNVNSLDVSLNLIKSVYFQEDNNIGNLILDHNNLETINFENIPKISRCNLSFNNLKELIIKSNKICTLLLQNNQLKSLEITSKSLNRLNINNNNFQSKPMIPNDIPNLNDNNKYTDTITNNNTHSDVEKWDEVINDHPNLNPNAASFYPRGNNNGYKNYAKYGSYGPTYNSVSFNENDYLSSHPLNPYSIRLTQTIRS